MKAARPYEDDSQMNVDLKVEQVSEPKIVAPMVVELHRLLGEIEQDKKVAVVVFDSAGPDFFLAHYDIAADASVFEALLPGPSL